MSVDWRTWLYQLLTNDADVLALVPAAQIHGAGSLTSPPEEKPFIMIQVGAEVVSPVRDCTFQDATLWIHDEPGSYLNIDNTLKKIRSAMEGASRSNPDVIQAVWQGDSPELADDFLKTITRNGSYRLVGRR